ncbi:hypothetical protein [Shewanella sp. 125m-1]
MCKAVFMVDESLWSHRAGGIIVSMSRDDKALNVTGLYRCDD